MKASAGLLIYRHRARAVEVLLAHPGGPLWAKKDAAAWSIFKGELDADEEPLEAAKREFEEETSQPAPTGELMELTPIKRSDGKTIYAWAVEADYDPATIISNTFSMEWPPHSGKQAEFPENDRAEWFDVETAKTKLHSGQEAFITELMDRLPTASMH